MRSSLTLLALSSVLLAGTALAADTAGQAALEHGRKLVDLLDKGDRRAVAAYLQANGAPRSTPPNPPVMELLSRTYLQARGAKYVADGPVEPQAATVVYENPTTKGQQALKVTVEPQPPFNMTAVTPAPTSRAFAPFAPDAPLDERLKGIDAYVETLTKADGFSGVVLIAASEKPLLNKAYGLADRTAGAANTLDTKFSLASLNKMFTAVAIARLVEQGQLSWDDPLSKFLPDFPDAESARKIQIKHLLSHTSGLGSFFNPTFFATPKDQIRTLDDYMRLNGEKGGLAFEPGTRWSYSNNGYLALGKVIEKVTGQDYYDYMRQTLFAPLGMNQTDSYALDSKTPNMARPYETSWTDAGLQTRDATPEMPVRGSSAGGGYSTAGDLFKWATAFKGGKLVSAETAALMTSPKLELGSANGGYGFEFGRLAPAGRKIVGAPGDTVGTCVIFDMIRDADNDYTVIILANSFMGSCHRVARAAYQALPAKAKP
ncbi:serine hydrolase domain-containing protein [Caulobacter sp. NIBR2454]|uniref:serine hydrolase domain-containing protein n=1 Tax=Caulobacter sp. NIBR2454 TaxID=3015996 RepID=UPI0022B6743E|nr:serine hydrolase domain-containing protein [Caulobacter sp. NIBR2454]